MSKIFNEDEYGFTDSIIDEVKLDKNMRDYLIVVDYFVEKNKSSVITLRLKNVKEFNFIMNYEGRKDDTVTPYTIAHISKAKNGKWVEIIITQVLFYFTEHQKDKPLIRCLCEDAYIETNFPH